VRNENFRFVLKSQVASRCLENACTLPSKGGEKKRGKCEGAQNRYIATSHIKWAETGDSGIWFNMPLKVTFI
jgi:hypothetical protein